MNNYKNNNEIPTYHMNIASMGSPSEIPYNKTKNLINNMKIREGVIKELIQNYKKLINNKTSSYINNGVNKSKSKKSIDPIREFTIKLLDELLVNENLSNNQKKKDSIKYYETFKQILESIQKNNNNYKGGKRKNKRKSTKKDKRLGKYKHNGHTHKTKQAMKKCTK